MFDLLHELRADVKAIREQDLPALRIEIAVFKAKASVWGALGGMAGGAVVMGAVQLLGQLAFHLGAK